MNIRPAMAAYEQKEYIGARETKIGDYDAVEVVGKYIDPDLGLIYIRIVGIPNPDAADGIYAVGNVVAARFDLQGLDDLALTGGGKTLSSFEYIEEQLKAKTKWKSLPPCRTCQKPSAQPLRSNLCP